MALPYRALKNLLSAWLLLSVFFALVSCQSVSTATAQETAADTKQAADDFDPGRFPGPGSTLTPGDQRKVENARQTLVTCGQELLSVTAERDELQKKLDEVTGIFVTLERYAKIAKWIWIAFFVGVCAGIIGTIIWPQPWKLFWGLIKTALKIGVKV